MGALVFADWYNSAAEHGTYETVYILSRLRARGTTGLDAIVVEENFIRLRLFRATLPVLAGSTFRDALNGNLDTQIIRRHRA